MPWTVEKKGSTFCVFKQGADKHPTGEALKCYPTNAEAQDYMKALYANEPEARERGLLREFWTKLKDFFAPVSEDAEPEQERAIKDVASWDGSAAQWPDAGSYCQDTLIDAHAAAGKTEKTKALCFLPIRGPDDPNTTYVRQAAHACAGGRGISRLVKPAEVSEADWLRLKKEAARKLIAIYKQMDETPPDSLYEAAGEQAPKRESGTGQIYVHLNDDGNLTFSDKPKREGGCRGPLYVHQNCEGEVKPEALFGRAVSLSTVASQVASQLYDQGFWLNDLYEDNGAIVAIVTANGKLYRAPITVKDNDVTLGELAEVAVQFAQVPGAEAPTPEVAQAETQWAELEDMMMSTGRMTLLRQADGHYRWFAVTESSVLNRVGEIDSRALFDSFIANIEEHGYPVLRFYHTEGLDFGRSDWAAREDNLLLASGVLDEAHPISRALIQDAGDQHSGVTWGVSNGYRPTVPPRLVEVARDVRLPVYTAGIWREISLLPESSAASLYTQFSTEVKMRADVKETLRALLKDDAMLAKIESEIDGMNREIADKGLVTRDAPQPETVTAEAAPAAQAEAPATTTPAEAATVVEAAQVNETVPLEAQPAEAKPEPKEYVLDAETMAEIAKLVKVPTPELPVIDIAGALDTAMKTHLQPLFNQVAALSEQVQGLQREADGRAQIKREDMPARQEIVVTHRPKTANAATGPAAEPTLAERANHTMDKLPKRVVPGTIK